jgi:hypothetical protein
MMVSVSLAAGCILQHPVAVFVFLPVRPLCRLLHGQSSGDRDSTPGHEQGAKSKITTRPTVDVRQ